MVTSQLQSYINEQLFLKKTTEEVTQKLIQSGWHQDDINEALGQIATITPPARPKTINVISVMCFIMAAISTPATFAGSFIILTTNRATTSIPGGLDYSVLRAFPVIIPISLPSIISLLLILYTALRVRSGSESAWKSCLAIIFIILVLNIISGFMTSALINPILSTTDSI